MKKLVILLLLGIVGTANAELGAVYFDLGKATLRQDAKVILTKNVDELKATNSIVLIEGRCDYRGDSLYNLSLGQLRSTAIRKFYMSHGIPAARLVTISFGKEDPLTKCHYLNRSGTTTLLK
jgi:peptidoglycan-associated lipoprotein